MQNRKAVQHVLFDYMLNTKLYKFEPGAMSIIQMGEELIGHPSTAINELVKNAYDADADKCWVYTQYHKDSKRNFLIIKDNGLGMDTKTLFGDWLKPSKSSKRDEDREKRRSPIYERRFLGSKGIGRLASMALGQFLTVITKKSTEAKYNWLIIDRERFRVEDLLDEVFFPGGNIEKFIELFNDSELLNSLNLKQNGALINILQTDEFKDFKEGTMIILQNLDDSVKTIIENEINTQTLDEMSFFKSLRDLITPLKLTTEIQNELVNQDILSTTQNIDNGSGTFDLYFGANFIKDNFKQNLGFVLIEPSQIIKFYDYRVFGKVTNSLDVIGKYLCQRFKDNIIVEDFLLSSEYLLDEEKKVENETELEGTDADDSSVDIGEFYFDFRVYDLDVDSKDELTKQLKASGRREATQVFSKYLGLKISKNGFGVKPYGEEEQDWLGLGAKRVSQHQVSIGPNQIIGYTFLYSPQNDSLNEKTNREGFFENKAFITFKKILNGILREVGQRRGKFREKNGLGRIVKSKLDRPDATRFLEYVMSNHRNDSELIRISKEFIKESESAFENIEDSLSFSQRLASLGTGLELVYHELSQPINGIGSSLSSLITNTNKLNDDVLKKIILDRADNIKISLNTLETLKNSLQPAIGRSVAKLFKPYETFRKVIYLFENSLNENKIRVIYQDIDKVEIREIEYVFWISFLNIINNAIYWLKQSNNERIIYFTHEINNTFVLSNTGPKIQEDELEIIFNYGITNRKEQNATGLGLAFTKSLLSTKNWEIKAENRNYGPAFLIYKN